MGRDVGSLTLADDTALLSNTVDGLQAKIDTPAYWALNRHLTIIFGTGSYISYLCWPSVEHYGGFSGISFSTVLAGADPGFGNGGPRFLAKRVTYTSETSYERSEYKSAGNILNLEPLRVNLSVI